MSWSNNGCIIQQFSQPRWLACSKSPKQPRKICLCLLTTVLTHGAELIRHIHTVTQSGGTKSQISHFLTHTDKPERTVNATPAGSTCPCVCVPCWVPRLPSAIRQTLPCHVAQATADGWYTFITSVYLCVWLDLKLTSATTICILVSFLCILSCNKSQQINYLHLIYLVFLFCPTEVLK